MKLELWPVCWLFISSAWLARSVSIIPLSTSMPEVGLLDSEDSEGLLDSEASKTGNGYDTKKALNQWRDLKANLLKLKPDYIPNDSLEDSNHERHLRTLFPAGYNGCSCSDLAAIAAQITIFEEEVKDIDDLENKISLIATAIKQLGRWVESGVRGPQGPDGPPGPPGITGPQGDSGDAGSDTSMVRQGVPGPQGASGPSGVRGPKGIRGDCIKGQKGTLGKKGEPGVGVPGRRGVSGPPGLLGIPAPDLESGRK